MASLVAYGSSDEEDDIQPEKPAKIDRSAAQPNTTSSETPAPTPANPTPASASVGPTAGPSAEPAGPSAEDTDSALFSPYTYERQRLRELTMPTVPNFDIPNSPPPPPTNSEEAAALAATTKKFERFLELKKQGVHFNERLQNSTSLRNPSLLPKLMDFAGISQEDSYATSLSEGLGVAVTWPEECYVESLVRRNERKEKKRVAEREKVEFVSASKSAGSSAAGTPGGGGGEAKKSRFDKR
ncbi:hypothetical protein M409DRAFT_66575 [Zasmidium cellare ATCC 36951]|uniref:HCNGP-like protein n=1 Tax=Zasmidium cellare ATCC 36951 TaxID=1080233 RepID=A0A6A6CIX6_ZASCE|nr:uncharacterized protein M409DRAFT_66575 [Zasmidium cellare ATCC 36951]KAF2166553.1 hypothetical protein M409DRAFT_66575 [Zasmidium cellare ATCC 36951]